MATLFTRAKRAFTALFGTDGYGDVGAGWIPVGGNGRYEQITSKSILTIGDYFACCRNIGQDIATMPFGLRRREVVDGKKASIEVDDTLAFLLSVAPNPLMTAYDFWETMIPHKIGIGNAYAEIVPNRGMTNIAELWPIHPSRVTPKIPEDGYSPTVFEVYGNNGVAIEIPARRMFHLKNIGSNGRLGYPTAALMQNTLDEANCADRFVRHSMHNMARPFIVIQSDEVIQPEARNALKQEWAQLYAGPENAGRAAIVDNGLKINSFQTDAKSMQLIEQRLFTKEKFACATRMPLRKMMNIGAAQGWATMDAEEASYVQDCLAPHIKGIEQAIRQQLMSNPMLPAYASNIDPHFEIKGRMKGDHKTRGEWYKTLFFMGVITPNEIRAMEDMNPINLPYMDKTFLQGATIPAELAGLFAKQSPQGKKAGTEPGNGSVNIAGRPIRMDLNGVH